MLQNRTLCWKPFMVSKFGWWAKPMKLDHCLKENLNIGGTPMELMQITISSPLICVPVSDYPIVFFGAAISLG
jgi:hypothetical protein